MRSKLGVGTPRGLQGALREVSTVLCQLIERVTQLFVAYRRAQSKIAPWHTAQVAA